MTTQTTKIFIQHFYVVSDFTRNDWYWETGLTKYKYNRYLFDNLRAESIIIDMNLICLSVGSVVIVFERSGLLNHLEFLKIIIQNSNYLYLFIWCWNYGSDSTGSGDYDQNRKLQKSLRCSYFWNEKNYAIEHILISRNLMWCTILDQVSEHFIISENRIIYFFSHFVSFSTHNDQQSNPFKITRIFTEV